MTCNDPRGFEVRKQTASQVKLPGWGNVGGTSLSLARESNNSWTRTVSSSKDSKFMYRANSATALLHYCQDKFCHIDVALQVVVEKDQPSPSNPHVLLPEDLIYDAERIAELSSSDGLEHKQEFLKAIIKEFSDLCKNDCFSLEVIPEERSPLSTRIVLKVKRKGDGSFDKFKARCV
ncbi:hypothetical protein AURANDRAFT_68445, partial [Aureococcus anophagefferens]